MKKLLGILRNPSLGLLLIRIGLATIFIYHGVSKFADMGMTIGFFAKLGFPAFLAYFVSTVETLGGVVLLLGLFTDIAGIALAIDMAVVLIHVPGRGGFLGGHELEFSLLIAALGIALEGPGKYALGGKIETESTSTTSA